MDSHGYALVLNTLQRACSQSLDVLKPAELQLKEWETQAGFYSTLLSIFSDKSIDVNIRWLAVLYFKNGVDRYWRRHASKNGVDRYWSRHASNSISDEEKSVMRKLLVSNFHEPVNQLATQLAVLVGKIARLDCPKYWPELLPTLLDAVRSCQDELHQQRILLTFYQVIKCLASRRLGHDRRVFEELSQNIFDFVVGLWESQMSQFDIHIKQNNINGAELMLEYAHLTLKVLRRLVIYGFKEPRKHENVRLFLQQCIVSIKTVTEAKAIFQINANMMQKREKMMLLFTKLLLDLLQLHSDSYIDYVIPTLEIVVKYCFTEDGKQYLYERFTVNLFNLMKDIIKNDNFRPSLDLQDVENQPALQAQKLKSSFFTREVLGEILKGLVYQYLPLNLDDLELWDSDPEDFIHDDGGDSWKYCIKPCVETLYVTMFKEYREILTPILLSAVSEVQAPVDVSDMSAILVRDAIYNAVGLASFDIYDEVDFDSWLTNQLFAELANRHSHYRIIRRRVIWVIGCWVGVKMAVSLRPAVYEAILTLLKPGEDMVVRLEAAYTLKATLDDFEFNTEQFSPYMESSFHALFLLLTEVNSCDCKMKVLHVMSFLIERVGSGIAPHAPSLIDHLPILWQSSEAHNLLRCAIITTICNLIQGLGANNSQLHHIVVPVIQLSTDIHQDAHVYLLEDGLHLWEILLYNTCTMTPDILELFSAIPSLLDQSTENIRICLQIIEAYLLLAGEQLMTKYGVSIVDSLMNLVDDLRMEGLILVLKMVESFFKLYPKQASVMFRKLIISKILPAVMGGEDYPMVVSVYLSIISRVVMEDTHLFFMSIAEYALLKNRPDTLVLKEFLQTWFDKLDLISQPQRKKLCAIALASLLPTNIGAVVENFDPLINACVQVLHDVCHSLEDDSGIRSDTLVIVPGVHDLSDDETDTEHDKRNRMVSRTDPVYNIYLDQYIWTKLNELQAIVGQEQFNIRIDTIDSDIKMQLMTFMRPYMQSSHAL